MAYIPLENVITIVAYLDASAIRTLAKVSRFFHGLPENEKFLRHFFGHSSNQFKPYLGDIEKNSISIFELWERFKAFSSINPSPHCYISIDGGVDRATSIQLSTDGTRMAVWFCDTKYIELIDLTTKKILWTRDVDCDDLYCEKRLLFTPDGKKIVFWMGSSESNVSLPGIIVLDSQTGIPLLQFAEMEPSLKLMQMHPDGKSILTTSCLNNTIKHWCLESGSWLQDYRVSNLVADGGYVVKLSPDGKTAISNSNLKGMFFWDLHSGLILKKLENKPFKYFSFLHLDISQNSRNAICWNWGDLKVWDLTTGHCVHSFEDHELLNDPDGIRSARISTDGNYVLLASKAKVGLLNLKNRVCQAIPTTDEIVSTAMPVGSSSFVIGNSNGRIDFWNFCKLPEERLTDFYVENRSELFPRNVNLKLFELSKFPQFVGREIEEMTTSLKIPFLESVRLYIATEVALTSIKKHLQNALVTSKLSLQIKLEAINRIVALPNDLSVIVSKHYCEIQIEKGRSIQAGRPNVILHSSVKNETFVEDLTQAITRTILALHRENPQLAECLLKSRHRKLKLNSFNTLICNACDLFPDFNQLKGRVRQYNNRLEGKED